MIALLLSVLITLHTPIVQQGGRFDPVAKGLATWYNAARRDHSSWYTRKGITLYAAAGPALRRMFRKTYGKGEWRKAWVTITSVASGKSVTLRLLDWCGCHGRKHVPDDNRLVDLSLHAWRAIDQHFVRRVSVRRATIQEISEWRDRQDEKFD
jgi:hypothetical protein